MQNRPPPGSMVWWRPLGPMESVEWKFGYCTYVQGHDMVRMGRWNGDNSSGPVVSCNDIEWKPYKVGD